jgi:hypothetical protein
VYQSIRALGFEPALYVRYDVHEGVDAPQGAIFDQFVRLFR